MSEGWAVQRFVYTIDQVKTLESLFAMTGGDLPDTLEQALNCGLWPEPSNHDIASMVRMLQRISSGDLPSKQFPARTEGGGE